MNEFMVYFNNDEQLQEIRKMGILSDCYHMDYGGGSVLLKTHLSKKLLRTIVVLLFGKLKTMELH